MKRISSEDYFFLRLLTMAPFEPRLRGGWRFGIRRISEAVVDRLIGMDLAAIEDGRVVGLARARRRRIS